MFYVNMMARVTGETPNFKVQVEESQIPPHHAVLHLSMGAALKEAAELNGNLALQKLASRFREKPGSEVLFWTFLLSSVNIR